MGKWIKRKHEHDFPITTYDLFTTIGDVWECQCGETFAVTSLSRQAGGDYGKSYFNLTFAPDER